MVAAADFFLFDDQLLAWLLLAFGGAMVAGNVAAMLRPPPREPGDGEGELERPPTGRTLGLVAVGLLATVWAIASLIRG